MKKAYTITPEMYKANIKTMNNARYHHGQSLTNAPESVKKKCIKAAKENATFEIPDNPIFLENEVLYNLFLNRDTDEPITARELYAIVQTITEAIEEAEDNAKSSAAWSNWDGR